MAVRAYPNFVESMVMPAAWKLRSIILNQSSESVGVNSGILSPILLISLCGNIVGVCSLPNDALGSVVSMSWFLGFLGGECSIGICVFTDFLCSYFRLPAVIGVTNYGCLVFFFLSEAEIWRGVERDWWWDLWLLIG